MKNDLITSHKLIYHPKRVSNWMETGDEYPINAEIGISGACNHRCIFCVVDYTKYKPAFLAKDLLHERIKEMQGLGLRSVLLAGNGEPLLNKDAIEIINDMKNIGLDVALSTNGVLFTKDKAEQCMKSLSWIRYSVSAGTEKNYQKIHRGKAGDLQRVFDNIADSAQIKRINNLNTIINVQIVMTPDNMDEVILLAEKAKELGVDRFIAKTVGVSSYTENEFKNIIGRDQLNSNYKEISEKLDQLMDNNFECVYRSDRVNNNVLGRSYTECLASAFHVCIDADGNVVPCCTFLGIPEMAYGNIITQSFQEIWDGCGRKEVLEKLKQSKLAQCPLDCKLANMNCYLQELKCPGDHVNFI